MPHSVVGAPPDQLDGQAFAFTAYDAQTTSYELASDRLVRSPWDLANVEENICVDFGAYRNTSARTSRRSGAYPLFHLILTLGTMTNWEGIQRLNRWTRPIFVLTGLHAGSYWQPVDEAITRLSSAQIGRSFLYRGHDWRVPHVSAGCLRTWSRLVSAGQ